jgi:hypothetical protein
VKPPVVIAETPKTTLPWLHVSITTGATAKTTLFGEMPSLLKLKERSGEFGAPTKLCPLAVTYWREALGEARSINVGPPRQNVPTES